MEIKDTLKKPYTKEKRLDFIVKYQSGYEIRETENSLEAWGYTQEEEEQNYKNKMISDFKMKLAELDEKTIRPIRAKLSGKSTEEDEMFLNQIELQAEQYRDKIKELQK